MQIMMADLESWERETEKERPTLAAGLPVILGSAVLAEEQETPSPRFWDLPNSGLTLTTCGVGRMQSAHVWSL